MRFLFWLRLSRLLFKTRSFALVPFFSPPLLPSSTPTTLYLASPFAPLSLPTSSTLTLSSKKHRTSVYIYTSCFFSIRLHPYPCAVARLSFVQSRAISLSGNRACKSAPSEIGLISIPLRFPPPCGLAPPPARHSSHFTQLPSICPCNRARFRHIHSTSWRTKR
ncbi:hypothetical protein TRIATDRAFT_301430 [Trichoderma atroviride IMI 206040]|uniref:Secreted protein n=1 Tax=Hypocrea atroviridis (strain ATCC 20476 / IMI 206040) TaxID=452589 RepID=G9P6G6_HYPAI|nr:uncharacterized protein TRIATDRAFT_301430 [Trichoderma atroviride IMI 206040]EHK40609.1 hypothetical protein TRIATDRAFT_301430 [Trichoderma atroviride IMI 206040]